MKVDWLGVSYGIEWGIGSHINPHTVNLLIHPVLYIYILYIHPVVSYPQQVINTVDKSVDKSAWSLWITCG